MPASNCDTTIMLKERLILKQISRGNLLFYWELQKCFPSGVIDIPVRQIASTTGYKSTMTYRHLKSLVAVGLLERTAKDGKSYSYRLKKVED